MLTARGLSRGAVNAVLEPAGAAARGQRAAQHRLRGRAASAAPRSAARWSRSFGVATALAVDAASFAVVARACSPPRATCPARREPARAVHRARARGPALRAHGPRRAAAARRSRRWRSCFFTLIVPIEIVYAKETLGTDEAGYGVLLSSWGAGIVLGSLLFLGLRRRAAAMRVIAVSTLAIGCAYLGMAVARELWVACAFSVVGGIGNGVQWVSVMTALQESTPDDLQARVTGLLESIASAMTGVGFLIGGVDHGDLRAAHGVRGVRRRRGGARHCWAPCSGWCPTRGRTRPTPSVRGRSSPAREAWRMPPAGTIDFVLPPRSDQGERRGRQRARRARRATSTWPRRSRSSPRSSRRSRSRA